MERDGPRPIPFFSGYNFAVMKLLSFSAMTRLLVTLYASMLWISAIPGFGLDAQSAVQSPKSAPDHRALAADLVAKHRWREAEKEYRIYRNEHPDSVDAIVRHAEALMEIGQPFDAALELQKFLQAHPDSPRALELHALLSSGALHDASGAEADLEKCVKLDPNNFLAWKSLGDFYLDQARNDDAIHHYLVAVKLRPEDPIAVASLAYVRSLTNAPEEAAAGFKEAARLAREPREVVGVQTLHGRYLLDAGQKEEAVNAFSQALAADRNSTEALTWRAEAYAGLQKLPQAETDALAALERSPNDKRSALLLLKIYRQQGMTEKAEKYALIVQKLADAEDAHFAMGRTLRDNLGEAEPLLLKGDYKEAAVRYEAIVKTLPSFYEAYFDLGMCYSQTGRLTDAEAAFRKYLAIQPASADGRASLGVLLLAEGHHREAIPELEEAIQIDPTMTEARKNLASAYLQESDPKAAVAVLRPAENEKDEQVLVLLALALEQTSAYAHALEAVNRALALLPGDSQAIQIKQEILAAAGKH
jgi:tetratricopeptide (TPR) repeat protein